MDVAVRVDGIKGKKLKTHCYFNTYNNNNKMASVLTHEWVTNKGVLQNERNN